MSKGVAITGMGIISAIGNNVAENYEALINEKKGITRVDNIETIQRSEIMVGEVKFTNDEMISQLNLPPENNYSRTALLGAIAAKEAFANAGISDIKKYKTGIISGTSVGGMDMTEKYYYEYLTEKPFQKYIESHHAGDSTQKIAQQLGIEESLVTTISTACSSAANAIMLGARLIKSGKLDRVLVGGADCLSKFTINGFKTLMILSDTYNTPFDENRKGLNLGEAAAFLVLESDEVVKAENKKVLAYVKGYGNANDAFHQTASSDNGDGATLAMEKALKRVKGIVAIPEVGEVYEGKVKSIMPFGAFVEFMPGKDGLLHISEIKWDRLEKMEGVLEVGEEIKVKLVEVDKKTGKYRLSRKVLLPKPENKTITNE